MTIVSKLKDLRQSSFIKGENHWPLITGLAIFKLLLHLLTNTQYGLHRDEYLYFDSGNHLAWGYMEIPPFTAFIAYLTQLLGGSQFIIRLFPALIGMSSVILLGNLIRELGGKAGAILLGCTGWIFSLAFLGSNSLFQPVSFNQFFWLLSASLLVKLVKEEAPKYWYMLGIIMGIGILTKYSIAFYLLGLAFAFLISPHRKWYGTKHPWIGLVIGVFIALPNIMWQLQHELPILAHMKELRETQLVNVNWADFILVQFLAHFMGSIIWIAGLIAVFSLNSLKSFRFIGIAFLFTILLIGSLNGKPYYTFGSYSILYVFGGLAWEKWVKSNRMKVGIIAIIIILTAPLLPYALPLLPIEKMKAYCSYMNDEFGLDAPLTWENGSVYEIPQDYADMHGWDEMAKKTISFYLDLPLEKQQKCMIYGGSYGHTGALNYFGRKYKLPEAQGFNGSYMIWANPSIDFNAQLAVEDTKLSSEEYRFWNTIILIDSVEHPLARDPGYIYYKENPKVNTNEVWKEIVKEEQSEFNFWEQAK